MRPAILARILLLLSTFSLQADTGCFPCRRRKTGMSAKTSLEANVDEAVENHRVEDLPMMSTAQMVEQAVETVKEDELEEERRREARGSAIRILAQVLDDLTERPRSYRREYFGYCVIVQWSFDPIINFLHEADHKKRHFDGLMPIFAFGQFFKHTGKFK